MAPAQQAASIESRTSWVVAIAAVIILSVSSGAPIIVVVALRQIATDMGEVRAIPALASSLAYLGAGAGGVLMGWLAGRIGTRVVAITGGAMVCGGLLLAAGGAPWQLLLGYGLLVGFFGNGALFPPLMTYVSLWFDRRRGTALALVSSGQYIAGALWPALFEAAVATHGWQRTMLGFGLFVAVITMPLAALVLRPPPPPCRPRAAPVAGRCPAGGPWACRPTSPWRRWPSPPSSAACRWRCRRRIWWPSAATSASWPRAGR
ncbi:MFS transporter [Siccirubricoccus sp. G192]|uniref:MFS transporter n=1 Tax=Siccirubricoccus sp. G192 TaxID=2849651 RepID=UPI001C2C9C9A|nr:MFS transporter [Siccirubricoccus sp. G192]MBV1796679.1 MFS transporter [Siccirubricoccus sp. G192]